MPVALAYALIKRWMERELLNTTWRRPWTHAGTRAQHLLEESPLVWRVYQAGIAAGRPSEYQKPREIRTERDRLWHEIERRGRERVAQSVRPLTLRNAVAAVVQTPEGDALYRAYVKAAR
jgi:hypothetical protein